MPAVICPSPLVAGLFSQQVASAEIRSFRGSVCLSEKDKVHVRNASPRRQDEFAAGRLCAVTALESLGIPSASVGREAGGAPIWPAGVIGSISHIDNVAAAVVTRSAEVKTIGLDVERIGRVQPALWPLLFSQKEHRRLTAADPHARDTLATALFASKEAFYKAQWQITREWLDFVDVEIELKGRSFWVFPQTRKAWTRSLGEPLIGLFSVFGDTVAAAIFVPVP